MSSVWLLLLPFPSSVFLGNRCSLAIVPGLQVIANEEKKFKLKRFFLELNRASFKVLDSVIGAVLKLSSAVQTLVFDVVFQFIKEKLAPIASMPCWTAEKKLSEHETPTFSATPSLYIRQIGEHLLTLPQQLNLDGGDADFDEEDSLLGEPAAAASSVAAPATPSDVDEEPSSGILLKSLPPLLSFFSHFQAYFTLFC